MKINELFFWKKDWELTFSGWAGGHFKKFHSKDKAIEYAISHWNYGLFIDLKNLKNGERIRLKDNPEEKPRPEEVNCKHHWIYGGSGVTCDECGAHIPLACSFHCECGGGSIACSNTINRCVKRLNKQKDKGKLELKRWRGDEFGKAYCKICGKELIDSLCYNEVCALVKIN